VSTARTAAEQQIELLRQLKDSKSKRKAVAPAPLRPASAAPMPASPSPLMEGDAPQAGHFELIEMARKAKAVGPALPLSRDTWKRLRERQALGKEFASRKAMGDWAAELLLALPPQASRMDKGAKAELFKRLREWAEARGLR
jgi:hypothetical protein